MKSSSVKIKFNVTMKVILLIVHGMRKKLILYLSVLDICYICNSSKLDDSAS